jgi:hypothetical protein
MSKTSPAWSKTRFEWRIGPFAEHQDTNMIRPSVIGDEP